MSKHETTYPWLIMYSLNNTKYETIELYKDVNVFGGFGDTADIKFSHHAKFIGEFHAQINKLSNFNHASNESIAIITDFSDGHTWINDEKIVMYTGKEVYDGDKIDFVDPNATYFEGPVSFQIKKYIPQTSVPSNEPPAPIVAEINHSILILPMFVPIDIYHNMISVQMYHLHI